MDLIGITEMFANVINGTRILVEEEIFTISIRLIVSIHVQINNIRKVLGEYSLAGYGNDGI